MGEYLTALGTGYAIATKCFTTCFTLSDGREHFMIDTGGGNGLLTNMERAGIDVCDVHHVFLSHKHTDHIMGSVWLLRMIGHQMQRERYEGNLHIYCHQTLAEGVLAMCQFMLPGRLLGYFGERIVFHCLCDGLAYDILGRRTTFFDTGSTKDLQYGFAVQLHNGKRLTFLGDEPYREDSRQYSYRADYFMHEAMCLETEEDVYHPHRIAHSTVKDAAEIAAELEVGALILYHTEDGCLERRKAAYTAEAGQYFAGRVLVPDDLDVLDLV